MIEQGIVEVLQRPDLVELPQQVLHRQAPLLDHGQPFLQGEDLLAAEATQVLVAENPPEERFV